MLNNPVHNVVKGSTFKAILGDYWIYIFGDEVPTSTDPYRVYDQVFIDGTYFHKKCLLVACTDTHVIAWHWCLRESSYEYLKLLDKIAQPLIVTTDGAGGALKALRTKWPDVAIQRCLVHVQRNTFADISRNPIHPAHKAIRKLGYMLIQVHNREDAARFTAAVHHACITFGDWLKERTYRSAIPAGQVPQWVSPNQKWWYTHRNARRALKRLEKLIHAEQLFAFLTPPEGVTQDLKATTNLLEGGINKQLKDLAGNHRSMFDEHQRITMDWWLFTHTEDPVPRVGQHHFQTGLSDKMPSLKSRFESQDVLLKRNN